MQPLTFGGITEVTNIYFAVFYSAFCHNALCDHLAGMYELRGSGY
jgi:hypothetical protein